MRRWKHESTLLEKMKKRKLFPCFLHLHNSLGKLWLWNFKTHLKKDVRTHCFSVSYYWLLIFTFSIPTVKFNTPRNTVRLQHWALTRKLSTKSKTHQNKSLPYRSENWMNNMGISWMHRLKLDFTSHNGVIKKRAVDEILRWNAYNKLHGSQQNCIEDQAAIEDNGKFAI